MYNPAFFAVTPPGALCVTGVAIGVSFLMSPLKTILYSVVGALQGAMGAYALALFGYSCSLPVAAAVGAAVGAAIGVPFALALGVSCLCPARRNAGLFGGMCRLILSVGAMLFASLALSLALALGPLPGLAVAAGSLITGVTTSVVAGCTSCVCGA